LIKLKSTTVGIVLHDATVLKLTLDTSPYGIALLLTSLSLYSFWTLYSAS